ncbi:putative ArsR family transcriptional regulator [Pseudochrobactrum saccharolyticum]|uniref:Putative ArsR family transcriptional regulator n=1 Tax=Pseudochrobactrum saccharolyticum TaxID=354352 RepID=A0A7W8AI90_9HYPH|nr:metalloregulator ArsR/SmtB family transcription factor [Pseudochrobactrum saccharolyticum]KAB0539229.1 transcriptional regulator [Pseudochrobactrum saccharolyticum]MBB5090740.1 putative ArsR family transcriptional regulator [Pseudochrobactrum saccharolyticum]
MSSSDIITSDEMNSAAQQSTADRLLFILKTRGPQTISELARLAGTGAENIRQQLQKSVTEGLIEPYATEKKPKAGRPVQFWHLTEKGNSRFPDSHAELTVSLLRHMSSLGEDLTERVISLREQEILKNYRTAMQDMTALEQRIDCLAELRSQEGYMSEWTKQPNGSWLLIENHCPICAAATACRGFCRSELNIFQAILGDNCKIERCEHILLGARRCAYRITQTG